MTNIVEIAAKTNLSISTISRALNRPEKVAEKTKAKIEKAIKDMGGYDANIFARNLRKGEFKIIGLIVSDILNDFHALLVKAVQDIAYQHEFTAIVCCSDENTMKELSLIQQLKSRMLQGLIIIPTTNTKKNLDSLNNSIPVIEIDRVSSRTTSDSILLNNKLGIELAYQHLQNLGHERITYIGGESETITFGERLNCFINISQNNPSRGYIEIPGTTAIFNEACQKTHFLLSKSKKDRPTAIIAGNNEIASAVVFSINQQGLTIPSDISVVAFDDPNWASFYPCPLTTIKQPAYEMGKLAAETLIKRLSVNDFSTPVEYRLDPELIIRQSTSRLV